MPPLDDAAVEEGLRHLLGWEGRDNEIVKTFVRADFAHAMVFVNEVALATEAAGHHPDALGSAVGGEDQHQHVFLRIEGPSHRLRGGEKCVRLRLEPALGVETNDRAAGGTELRLQHQ